MTQKPYLNLGCGRVILPAPKPNHYQILPDGLTDYALWHNVDRNMQPGVDEVVDLFRYPFPWVDNSFDGALCAHIVEHIPHEIQKSDESQLKWMHQLCPDGMRESIQSAAALTGNRTREILSMQDGWYAFFSELHRVLTPGSIIHVLSPYAWSAGAVTDPTHTRLITEHTFTHSLVPDPNAPFAYATGGLNLELDGTPLFNITQLYSHLLDKPELLQEALQTRINVAYEIYARLRVVK